MTRNVTAYQAKPQAQEKANGETSNQATASTAKPKRKREAYARTNADGTVTMEFTKPGTDERDTIIIKASDYPETISASLIVRGVVTLAQKSFTNAENDTPYNLALKTVNDLKAGKQSAVKTRSSKDKSNPVILALMELKQASEEAVRSAWKKYNRRQKGVISANPQVQAVIMRMASEAAAKLSKNAKNAPELDFQV